MKENSSLAQIVWVTVIRVSVQSTDSHLHWKMFDIGSNFHVYSYQCWNMLFCRPKKIQKAVLSNMCCNTPLHPWLRCTETFRSREFLLFPSHCAKVAYLRHSDWPRLVFGDRWGQSSERFNWLCAGSDSWFPVEGCDDVCICFPSIATELRSLNYCTL